MRFLWIWIVLATVLCGCRGPEQVPSEEPAAISRDPRDFTLPEDITAAAPHLQEHLYRLLHFNSPRFPVKREFVFMDMDREVMGQIHPHVTHLNLFHVAWWREGTVVWSGSVMLGAERGWMGFSERGFRLKLRYEDGTYHFSLVDGEVTAEASLPADTTSSRWIDFDEGRLFLHYYVFPKDLVAPRTEVPMRRAEEQPRNPH